MASTARKGLADTPFKAAASASPAAEPAAKPAGKPAAEPAAKPAAEPAAKPAAKPAAVAPSYASPASKVSNLVAPSAKKTPARVNAAGAGGDVGEGEEIISFKLGGFSYEFTKEAFRRAMDGNKFNTDAMEALKIVKKDTMTGAPNKMKQVRVFVFFLIF